MANYVLDYTGQQVNTKLGLNVATEQYVNNIKPKITSITLPASWTGNDSPYTQTVILSGITANSKVDLEPNSTVLAQMETDGTTALYIENNNGTLTAYALGAAPTVALTVQATIMEVSV